MSDVRVLSEKATKVIRFTYAIGGEPADPHNLLTDIARGVAVVGKLLQDLSDKYNLAGKRFTSWLITAGRLFWGIIELSVPNRVFRYIFRNWLWLIALVSLVIVVLGSVFNQPKMCGIGAALLFATYLCSLISHACYRFMFVGKFPQRFLRLAGASLLLLGGALIAHLLGDSIAHGLRWAADKLEWFASVKLSDLFHFVVAQVSSSFNRTKCP